MTGVVEAYLLVCDLAAAVVWLLLGLTPSQWVYVLIWANACALAGCGWLWSSLRWWRGRALRAEAALADRRREVVSARLARQRIPQAEVDRLFARIVEADESAGDLR